MNSSIQQLSNLRVEQVMARDVITIHEESSMSEAAKLLSNYGITGVPVVDRRGRCVGVLTASDFVQSQSNVKGSCVTPVCTDYDRSGLLRAEALDNQSVKACMSPKVQTIREHRSIVDAGCIMCEEHIHRLVVLNRQGKPVGIISSLDLVSALVHASQES